MENKRESSGHRSGRFTTKYSNYSEIEVFKDASSLKWFISYDGLMDTDRWFETEKEAWEAVKS